MSMKQVRRFLMLGLLPVVAIGLVLALAQQALAEVPAPGLDISMAVEGVDGCDTDSGDAVCYIDPGTTFTVDVMLNSLPDTFTSGYSGYDVFLSYTGLTTSGEPTTAEWPDCGFPATLATPDVSVRWGCAIGIDTSPSMYTGLMSTLDFSCTDDESTGNTITMLHSAQHTSINLDGNQAAEGDQTTEVLTINCGDEPTPTPPSDETGATATALPPTGSAPMGGNDTNSGLWVIIGLLTAAAAGATGIFGWRFARSR